MMMARKLLTLAISKNTNQDYIVICYDFFKFHLVSIELSKAEIVTGNQVFFDIGAVTEVEELREGTSTYPVGNKKVVERYSRKKLKEFFEKEKVNIEAFQNNRLVENYSIIKISAINNIYLKDNKLRMKFWTNGVPRDLVIRDYRWLTYIQNQLKQNNCLEQLMQYRDLFNSPKKTTFAILYKLRESQAVWIAGLHLL